MADIKRITLVVYARLQDVPSVKQSLTDWWLNSDEIAPMMHHHKGVVRVHSLKETDPDWQPCVDFFGDEGDEW